MNKKLPDNDVLQSFPESERKDISRIWKLAKKKRNTEKLDASELKAEWKQLQLRLKKEDSTGKERTTVKAYPEKMMQTVQGSWHRLQTGSSPQNRRLYIAVVAMAAVLLAGFAGWFFFVPVTIEAPRGAFVNYEWSDGTRVELNSGSQLTYYRTLQDGHRTVSLRGEAFFDIPPSDRSFVVKTHNARVVVHGTRFNVRSWGEDSDAETILTLIEGEVALSSIIQPENTILLEPGQMSRVDRQTEVPREPEEVDIEQALAWRDRGFYFADTSLSDVVAELERRYNSNIKLEDENLADKSLTLYVSTPQDLESIITSICNLTGCRFDWSNDQVVLY